MNYLLEYIIPGIIIAILSSIIASRLALQKFYSEKWWEKKESAYTELIDALFDITQYCDIKSDYSDEETRYAKEKVVELTLKYSTAIWKMKKISAIGSFMISEDAVKIIEKLNKRPEPDFENEPFYIIFEGEYIYYKKTLASIIAEAKKDLIKK